MKNHIMPKLIGLFLLVVAVKIAFDLVNGIAASGITVLVSTFGLEESLSQTLSLLGTTVMLLIAVVFGIRALLFNRICIGEQCALDDRSVNQ